MTDSTPTPTRPPIEAWAGATDCCDYDHHSDHDLLLTFESRGMAGVRYVVEAIDLSSDQEGEPGALPWPELPSFIGQHNWADPYAVYVLARFIADAIRDRKDVHKLTVVPARSEAQAS